MATVKGNIDQAVQALRDALEDYEAHHSEAEATLYRQNSASIRLRVVDHRFEGMTKSRRHAYVWQFLAERVSEDTLSEVSLVLAIAPSELRTSLTNLEFEEPTPSGL
jgi:stress-induced morphogen